MRHIKITLQYDGAGYSGWQIQNSRTQKSEAGSQKKITTIQGTIQEAIRRVTGEDTKVVSAARTDAGVHALMQVAAFKTESNLGPQVFLHAINAGIPHNIRVINAEECPDDFHPRYDAKSKTYSYIISPANTFSPSPLSPPVNGRETEEMPLTLEGGGRGISHSPLSSSAYGNVSYSVFLRKYSWQIPYQLNCSLMRTAAEGLIGKHDFSCFRASGCGSKHPVRTIFKIEVSEFSSVDFMAFKFNVPLIKISIHADAFLRHMVRNIVGLLVEVGGGKRPPSNIQEVLDSKDRRLSGPTAPANGLFLEEISY